MLEVGILRTLVQQNDLRRTSMAMLKVVLLGSPNIHTLQLSQIVIPFVALSDVLPQLPHLRTLTIRFVVDDPNPDPYSSTTLSPVSSLPKIRELVFIGGVTQLRGNRQLKLMSQLVTRASLRVLRIDWTSFDAVFNYITTVSWPLALELCTIQFLLPSPFLPPSDLVHIDVASRKLSTFLAACGASLREVLLPASAFHIRTAETNGSTAHIAHYIGQAKRLAPLLPWSHSSALCSIDITEEISLSAVYRLAMSGAFRHVQVLKVKRLLLDLDGRLHVHDFPVYMPDLEEVVAEFDPLMLVEYPSPCTNFIRVIGNLLRRCHKLRRFVVHAGHRLLCSAFPVNTEEVQEMLKDIDTGYKLRELRLNRMLVWRKGMDGKWVCFREPVDCGPRVSYMDALL
ncbi:hypothetical protein V5O48_004607 [Marasmius crinis-equi]|uniref:F-box domain-containing protein n=1 Tax=Marasmius crinis-equi TaxID=585013 RepID=A0ABR3FPN3_9AGAR